MQPYAESFFKKVFIGFQGKGVPKSFLKVLQYSKKTDVLQSLH